MQTRKEPDFWRVSLDTLHYSFEAFGKTKADAIAAFETGCREHKRQTDCALTVREAFSLSETRGLRFAWCYRDGETLTR